MFKFILLTLIFFIIMIFLSGARSLARVFRFFFGKNDYKGDNKAPEKQKMPETQAERIMSYQKKKFEVSEAEDVEFEEIKD